MALSSASRCVLLLSNNNYSNSTRGLSNFVCCSTKVLSSYDDKRSRRGEVRRFLLMRAPTSAVNLMVIPIRSFYYAPFNQLHFKNGILFDALQKSRVPVEEIEEERHYINIPDELHRLKSGSLKWLFKVWPGGSQNTYSVLSTIKSALNKEVVDSEGDVNKMITRNERMLRTANEQQLFDVLDYLKSKNIAIRRLLKLPWLLTGHPEAIEESVKKVKRLLRVKKFEVAISFVNMNEMKLMEVASVWSRERIREDLGDGKLIVFEHRIDWLSHRLSCPEEDVSDMMARYPYIMTMSPENIRQVLDHLLYQCNMKPESIISDPWVFQSNIKTLQSRLRILKQHGILHVKPWVFRKPQRNFDYFLQKQLDQRRLLGEHKDIRGFLQERLECSEEVVADMLERVPSIKTATVLKFNEMITFLLSQGFNKQQIKESPRILAHSVETIAERLKELTLLNKEVNNLQLLCRTSKDYRAILRKLKKEAKKTSSQNTSTSTTQSTVVTNTN